ncbi:alpha-D-xyloside xylohydrolase [Halanaerobium saccharolyticum]|uniref:alpha-D-xyloside xylohydrolase n=1 Tax=Halanaerobium saccharolyticum TaxID=43595 RepID=A0A4R7Z3J6_9FIRM|nr:alpha-xylosidase [Halanaerobium saccharolyticum]RAK12666.1 alpha-D-xyloside xylohydrolase [Halanaerobium saccharolyticum]TDW05422.1 alpha-D-xyloside xylohydrolase [Halanaerobium saccharolyticum]TDX62937.1 alpha-D-xyloside xylohydrolase [Halanaerobium saccharolyticum]
MKFTEGYWLRSEKANPIYASQAYKVEEIENGMKIIAPGQKIESRAQTLNIGTITLEFRAVAENVIEVKNYHHQGYDSGQIEFEKNTDPRPVEVTITEAEALMEVDELKIRVDRENWKYQFETEGEVLTSCGFRNLGYMRYDKKISSMLPGDNYLKAEYDPYMLTELSLAPGECVYGLGERFTAFVKNGQVVETWNEDGGTSSQVAYKSIPFYMTSRGYGIFVDHADNVSFEVASEKVEYVGFSVPGEELRYNFIYGKNNKEVLSRYTELTGKPALPPAWSFGLWLSTSFTTDYDEETTSSFIEGMAERDIPLDVFHFDCFWMEELNWTDLKWDQRTFPDPESMLERYHQKGLKVSVWLNPYLAQESEMFKQGLKNNYLLKRKDGKGIKQIDHWQPGMALVDFTNPEAVKWFQEKLKELLEMGVDAFKTDFGERIPVDVEYFDGSDPNSMHNYYSYIYNKAVFEVLEAEKGKNEAVLFARSATAGSQKFPVHWGGDSSASYASMAETLRGGLSFAMSGFSFWSHDIGGFEQTTTPDLYKRWVQFGLLSTHSRLHGSESYRVPWLFDEESSEVLEKFTKLKMRLMPYLYSMSVKAQNTGVPVMRPLILEFDQDPAVKYLDMQYMLGDSLLVAPIFNKNGKAEYYLPAGKWTHYLSGEVKEGGRWYQEEYDYFSLPLFVRENSLIAVGARDDQAEYDFLKGVSLHLYQLQADQEAAAELVNSDGEVVNRVSAIRNGDRLEFKLERLEEDMKLILHSIPEVKALEGGSYVPEDNRIVITPTEKKIIVEI